MQEAGGLGVDRVLLLDGLSPGLADLATEGAADDLRGRELGRLTAELEAAKTMTLRGVRCTGGPVWRFAGAPPRRMR